MTTISTALTLLILSQAPVHPVVDRRVQAIAPFVGNDVFAILQVDLARADLPALAAGVAGDSPAGLFAGAEESTAMVRLPSQGGSEGGVFCLQRDRHARSAVCGCPAC